MTSAEKSSLAIKKNRVALFHYQLFDSEADTLLEQSDTPQAILCGYKNILQALEEAMEGHKAGDEFTVALAPYQAYGNRVEVKKQRVPVKHLIRPPKKLKVGMLVKIQTEQGAVDATVIKAGKFNVDLDTNHPLAGKSLKFNLTIVDVREATAEELAHKHAHGLGGHHH